MHKSKKQKFLSFVSLILILLMQLTVLTPLAAWATDPADDIFGPDFPFITHVSLTDSNGQPLGTEVSKSAL